MEDTNEEGLFEKVKIYLQLHSRLYVLQATEKVARLYAAFVGHVAVLACLLMAFFFGSIALAYYLADYWNNVAAGFLTVMGLYLFLALLFMLFKKPLIERPLIDKTIHRLLNNEEGGTDGN